MPRQLDFTSALAQIARSYQWSCAISLGTVSAINAKKAFAIRLIRISRSDKSSARKKSPLYRLTNGSRGELAERSPGGARIRVVATGGHTYEPWLAEVPGIDAVEPDLTLRGIRYAFEAVHAAAGMASRSAATGARPGGTARP